MYVSKILKDMTIVVLVLLWSKILNIGRQHKTKRLLAPHTLHSEQTSEPTKNSFFSRSPSPDSFWMLESVSARLSLGPHAQTLGPVAHLLGVVLGLDLVLLAPLEAATDADDAFAASGVGLRGSVVAGRRGPIGWRRLRPRRSGRHRARGR